MAKRANATVNPFSLPMSLTPTQDEFNRFIILNVNEDNKTWQWLGSTLKYGYSSSLAADEWAFIPVNIASENALLEVTLEMKAQYADYPECFEVGIGTEATPASMTIVMDKDNIGNTQYVVFSAKFKSAGSGLNYLGIHANSAADRGGITIRNIELKETSGKVPPAPEILSSATDGESYTASVKLPDTTIDGEAIDGAVGLSVIVDGEKALDIDNGHAGEVKDVALTLAKGSHTVAYQAWITVNGKNVVGAPAEESVRIISNVAVPLPFFMEPTQEDFNDCTIIDSNGDSNTWYYSNSESAFEYSQSVTNKADDWVILTPIDFGSKGGAFEVSVDAKCTDRSCPESFEICVGRTPDVASMTPMMTCTGITNTIYDTFNGTITVSEGGRWYVGIHAVSEANMWNLFLGNIRINAAADNTPAMPEIKSIDLDGLTGTMTVTLPSTTVDNRPLTLPVGLIVTLDGTELTRTAPAEAGSDVTIPLDLALGEHTIAVAAFTGEGDTQLTGSQAVAQVIAKNPEGYLYPLPFVMQPTAGEFATLTVVDANNDGDTWEYNAGAGVARCVTKDGKSADDWLFTPKFAIEDTGRIYKVSAEVRAYLERFPESFEICIGREATPEAMTVLVDETDMAVYLYKEFAARYIAPEAGAYVIGIHRKSNGDAHTISVRNIRCEDSGMSALAPAACTDVTATPDPTGALVATVSFNMPFNAISGAALDPADMLTATVSCGDASVTVSGAPGTEQSVTIATSEGTSTVTVAVASAANGTGDTVSTSVRCGFDIPVEPVVTTAVGEDNLSMTITWSDPATGLNGGPVNTSEISHIIYVPTDESGTMWEKIATVPAGTDSYTYTVNSDALQHIAFVGVQAENTKGSSQLGLGFEVLGAPYPMPLTDDFSVGRAIYQPLLTEIPSDDYSTNWYLDRPGLIVPQLADEQTSALMCMVTAEDMAPHARVSLPKFTTAGATNVKATFTVYEWSAGAKATVYANCYDAKDVKVGEIAGTGSGEWKDYTFDLPAQLCGKKWVNFYVEVDFTSAPQAFIMRGYGVKEVFNRQISVLIKAPETMAVGEVVCIEGGMTNHADSEFIIEGGPIFTISGVDDKYIQPIIPDTHKIDPESSLGYYYYLTTNADMLGKHTITFGFPNLDDERPEDNVAEKEIEIVSGDHPIVTDLSGEPAADGSGITLTWSEPEIKRIGHDEVEDYEPFTYASNIGAWLNIDGDGESICGLGYEYPGVYEPKAFQVVDFSSIGLNVDIVPFSGTACFLAIVPEDATKYADDWLISPEVRRGTKVSFRLNVLSSEYGTESIDVLYSTTGRETADFKLLKTFSQNMRGWNPLEVTLPEDAKYFAFHYRMCDTFGILLDDIFYSPLTDAEVAGYHIYRDGAKIADLHPLTSFTDTEAGEGNRYNVAVVTELAGETTEHPLSNTFVNTHSGLDAAGLSTGITAADGCIVITGYAGQTATVCTPDGVTVATASPLAPSHRLPVTPGLYLVKAGSAVAKLTVR